jgi:hypothetical protein
MKAIHSMIAALGLVFVLPAPADAAQTDPEVIIYRFPGVRDSGSPAGTGVATVFHCTNFSGATETLRFVTRNDAASLLQNTTIGIIHLGTVTVATHDTGAYSEDNLLPTGFVGQGTTAIAATSINIIRTAMTIDAAAAVPIGVALRGIRFSPVPGSQE